MYNNLYLQIFFQGYNEVEEVINQTQQAAIRTISVKTIDSLKSIQARD